MNPSDVKAYYLRGQGCRMREWSADHRFTPHDASPETTACAFDVHASYFGILPVVRLFPPSLASPVVLPLGSGGSSAAIASGPTLVSPAAVNGPASTGEQNHRAIVKDGSCFPVAPAAPIDNPLRQSLDHRALQKDVPVSSRESISSPIAPPIKNPLSPLANVTSSLETPAARSDVNSTRANAVIDAKEKNALKQATSGNMSEAAGRKTTGVGKAVSPGIGEKTQSVGATQAQVASSEGPPLVFSSQVLDKSPPAKRSGNSAALPTQLEKQNEKGSALQTQHLELNQVRAMDIVKNDKAPRVMQDPRGHKRQSEKDERASVLANKRQKFAQLHEGQKGDMRKAAESRSVDESGSKQKGRRQLVVSTEDYACFEDCVGWILSALRAFSVQKGIATPHELNEHVKRSIVAKVRQNLKPLLESAPADLIEKGASSVVGASMVVGRPVLEAETVAQGRASGSNKKVHGNSTTHTDIQKVASIFTSWNDLVAKRRASDSEIFDLIIAESEEVERVAKQFTAENGASYIGDEEVIRFLGILHRVSRPLRFLHDSVKSQSTAKSSRYASKGLRALQNITNWIRFYIDRLRKIWTRVWELPENHPERIDLKSRLAEFYQDHKKNYSVSLIMALIRLQEFADREMAQVKSSGKEWSDLGKFVVSILHGIAMLIKPFKKPSAAEDGSKGGQSKLKVKDSQGTGRGQMTNDATFDKGTGQKSVNKVIADEDINKLPQLASNSKESQKSLLSNSSKSKDKSVAERASASQKSKLNIERSYLSRGSSTQGSDAGAERMTAGVPKRSSAHTVKGASKDGFRNGARSSKARQEDPAGAFVGGKARDIPRRHPGDTVHSVHAAGVQDKILKNFKKTDNQGNQGNQGPLPIYRMNSKSPRVTARDREGARKNMIPGRKVRFEDKQALTNASYVSRHLPRGYPQKESWDSISSLFWDKSSLLSPISDLQARNVLERCQQMSLGSVLTFYGYVRLFVDGIRKQRAVEDRTGEMQQRPPPEIFELFDAHEIDRSARRFW